MAVQGVRFDRPKSEIINSIKKHGGVLRDVCKEFDVSHQTIYNIVNADPEIKEALSKARDGYYDNKIEKADLIIDRILGSQDDEDRSLKAAMFLLNTHEKARARGYAPAALGQPQADLKPELLNYFQQLHAAKPAESPVDLCEKQTCEQPPQAVPDKSL